MDNYFYCCSNHYSFDCTVLILKSQLSPEKQASQIAHAIKQDDAKALSKEVTSGNSHLSEEEARAYLNYIKEEDDLTHVGNSIEQTTKEVKDNYYKNSSVDANGNNILNISKDGKNIYSLTIINLTFLIILSIF